MKQNIITAVIFVTAVTLLTVLAFYVRFDVKKAPGSGCCGSSGGGCTTNKNSLKGD